MQITPIHTLHEFDKLRPDWDAAYAADAHAQVFVSWAWLRGWFEVTPHTWFALAARPDPTAPYVAFFPVSVRPVRRYGVELSRDLHMGGNPGADYTGFVCPPAHEEGAVSAFAAFVQRRLRWDRFHLKDVLDPRLDFFLTHFPSQDYDVQCADNLSCPYIPLPESWDRFAQDFMGRWTRRDIQRFFRRVENGNGFRLAHAQGDNLEPQMEAFFQLLRLRWGPGEQALSRNRVIFRRCLENDSLWLGVLWDATEPVAGLAAFVDRQKKTFAAYMVAYDEKYSRMSPGKGMCGYGVRYAIQNGFQVFDFLRGDEKYKHLFGAMERFNRDAVIQRRGLRMAARRLVKGWGHALKGLAGT